MINLAHLAKSFEYIDAVINCPLNVIHVVVGRAAHNNCRYSGLLGADLEDDNLCVSQLVQVHGVGHAELLAGGRGQAGQGGGTSSLLG